MMSTRISQEAVNDLASKVPSGLVGSGEPSYLGEGFDVVVYQWGDHTLRFPIRRDAVELIENEYRWVPEAAGPILEAGFAIPTPRFRGNSSNVFGYPWIMADYVEGSPLTTIPLEDRGRVARDLATAFAVLHRPAPDEAPINPFRGIPLTSKRDVFDKNVAGSPHEPLLRRLYEAGCEADPWTGAPVWCHGDPHPANIITVDGRLSGLIDFGDLGQGDPAVDYAALYLGFTAEQRADARVILRAMGAADEPSLWLRARGWAAYVTASLLACESSALQDLGEKAVALLAVG